MEKRTCSKCERILQISVHDKCMFCGEPIPEIFKLTEYEKEKIQKDIDEREEKRKANKKKSKSREGLCGTEGGGGGGGCGSCGGG